MLVCWFWQGVHAFVQQMEFTGVDFSDGAVFYRITFQKNGWRKPETVFFDENNIGKQLDLSRVKTQTYMPYFTGAKFS